MNVTILAFFHILFVTLVFVSIDHFILKNISKATISLLPIILAEYTSLFLGAYLTTHSIDYYFHDQWFGFKTGVVKKSLFALGVIFFTICSIIIELPFYILATRNNKFLPGLKSSIISNLITNIPIGLMYLASNAFYSYED
ncbi:hypothetical protein [Terrimonas pollutisoli]|uniref:hypothetical protein n=1 Tax=Terrimonas pollutisoli TaxID=3034147 RepID=UPI0023EC5110|nr:hypothetical protein [Terrimonas sp. H1YJ31]